MWAEFSKKFIRRLGLCQQCLLCEQASLGLICRYCQADLPLYQQADSCHNLLHNVRISREIKVQLFDQLVALADYQWPYNWLISQLKFAHKLSHANALAALFCQHMLPPKPWPQLLMPIPLHPARLATRTYNQAACLAKCMSAQTGIPVKLNVLQRRHHTQAQSELPSGQRLRNVKHAFACHHPLAYQHVALIDDVVTTGATVSGAAQALRQCCPNIRIDVWAVCVTPERR